MLADRIRMASSNKDKLSYVIAFKGGVDASGVILLTNTFKEMLRVAAWTVTDAGVAYGNGILVVIADRYIHTSLNKGKTWSTWDSGFNPSAGNLFTDIIFANGKFVAITRDGYVCSSTNGTTWTIREIYPVDSGKSLDRITYIDGYFYITGDRLALRSSDALSWSYIFNPSGYFGSEASKMIKGVKHIFVVDGNRMVSSDGVSWSDEGSEYTFYDVAYGNGMYVIVGQGVVSYSSTASLGSWTTVSLSGSPYLHKVIFVNGIFVAITSNGSIYTSTNGSTWTKRTSGVTWWLNEILHDGKQFIVIGDRNTILKSTNGTTWTIVKSGAISDVALEKIIKVE